MPKASPDDRVRIKNIIQPEEDDIQVFQIIRYAKEPFTNEYGVETFREVPTEVEIEWNFKDGFFCAYGGKYYSIEAGAVKTYPRFLAEHIMKHIADYVITKKYLDTRKEKDGFPTYDTNILNNQNLRKQINNQIFQSVEEFDQGIDDSFENVLHQKFGNQEVFESEAKIIVDKQTTVLKEEEQTEIIPKELPVQKELPKSKDEQLQKARDEASIMGIIYSEKDTVDTIKSKILKQYA